MVTTKPRAAPIHALAVYAEPFVDGRRVAVFGDPTLGMGERPVELGARTVVEVAPGDDLNALRTRAFDLAIVTDPALFGDAAALISRVRRLVVDDGVAVVAAGEALDYYQLFDLVAGEFAEVRMVAQLSFRGVALVELGGEESPAVSVDTQLAEADRRPETFIAVASRRGAKVDPYAIIELPEPLEAAPEAEAPEAEAPEAVYTALVQEKLRADALEAQLEALGERAAAYETLQGSLALEARRVEELRGALAEERAEAEEGRAAVVRLEEAELRAANAERAAASVEAELGRLAQADVQEVARFEEALRERAQAIRALEAEVLRRDGMVRELVDSLDERSEDRSPSGALSASSRPHGGEAGYAASDPTPLTDELARENSILRWRLDALAMDLARRDAEALAGEWALQELEHELERDGDGRGPAPPEASAAPPSPPPAKGDVERRLAMALGELDALRLALAQEHAIRVRAESGEELIRARAEIERQAVLLEQLGRELEATRGSSEELR